MKVRLARLMACALPHLALWAVMLLALCPQANAFWQCQGRPCGTTAWTCCCVSSSTACGEDCVSVSSSLRTGQLERVQVIGHSTRGCHCTVASHDTPQTLRSPAMYFVSPVFVVSTIEPALRFEAAPDVAPLRPVEARGPPAAVYLASLRLRGPPCA